MNIEEINVPAQKIVSITYEHIPVSQLPQIIGPCFMKLAGYIERQGADMAGAPFVSYWDITDEAQIDPNDLRVEIGFPLEGDLQENPEFVQYHRGPFDAIRITYQGNYDEGMEAVYKEMLDWLKEHGKPFPGISYETYMSGEEIPLDEQVTVITMPYIRPEGIPFF